jgi:NAD(P)-dependent dehydrogenase (short-subunit alcohol dehydrogenase family)
MPMSLEGRVAIVTGSSRGIGKVLALQLAKEGADIAVCARSDVEGELPGTIGETAAAIEGMGRRALPIKTDLANDDDLDNVVAETLAKLGSVDILVNNAVIVGKRQPFVGGDSTFLDLAYRVNVRAPYKLAQAVSNHMATRGGGHIVNITSGAARGSPPAAQTDRRPEPDAIDPSYGITKAALDRITTAYAGELIAHNICMVSVSPGLVITERIRQAAIRPNVDFSRAESPEVIARAVSILCRGDLRYAGQILRASELVQSEEPAAQAPGGNSR